jgi:hypothetical protein
MSRSLTSLTSLLTSERLVFTVHLRHTATGIASPSSG